MLTDDPIESLHPDSDDPIDSASEISRNSDEKKKAKDRAFGVASQTNKMIALLGREISIQLEAFNKQKSVINHAIKLPLDANVDTEIRVATTITITAGCNLVHHARFLEYVIEHLNVQKKMLRVCAGAALGPRYELAAPPAEGEPGAL